ncbi:DUF481 domain-containing protein [Robertkochia solimangrovi]|uniref:DUF481 domain-containing protein n=1 Tax=Robertkochia solimangrovi TaxID=2213046 RepID=UPI001F55465F|nr:DUF481 domain-containing protein [Robertkochia solimangrovi]
MILLSGTSLLAQTDSLKLKNGNIIVGEVKSMDQGVLVIETDYSDDDFTIKWIEVIEMTSDQEFLITLEDGTRINSSVQRDPKNKSHVILHRNEEPISVPITDIVFLKSVKENFLSRLDASISVGYNFTKSSSLQQFTVRSTLNYTGRTWAFYSSYNSVRSKQDNTDEIHRTDASIGSRYFLKNDYFLLLSADFLANDEQKLKLRTAIKGGGGKYFVHSNKLYFAGGGGIAWNNENYTDETIPSRNSVEGFISAELNIFDMKNLDLISNLTVYPSITESGRVRSDFKVDLKYDLPLDFFIKLGFTLNYDNMPVAGAAKDDYVLQTTFGWEL